MSWRDILKRDSLRNWFNSPYNEEGKKRRKGFDREMGGGWWGKPRTKNKGYQRSKSFDGRMGGINRFDRPTSRYTPKPVKPKPEPTPKPTSKPKRQIIPRTLIDNYFVEHIGQLQYYFVNQILQLYQHSHQLNQHHYHEKLQQ